MNNNYAWAAGFIDGEGTITLKRFRSKYTTRGIHYQPYVSLGQATHEGHEAGVQKLQDLFGGSISRWASKAPRLQTVSWCVVSRQAVECLKKVRSYLVVKKKHADLLFRYYETVGKRKAYKVTDEEMAKREAIWTEIRSMNQKGKLHLQRLSEIPPKGDATV